jgi:peptidoglycan/xylan/chitin deacetylase (PgdA/CDA1 family)
VNGGWAAAGAAGAAAGGMAWAVRGRSSSVFGPSVYRGPRGRRALALTFDDGPSESTPRILETLARYRVPATFFQCGANVERLPAIAREVRAAGNEIGNHGHAHPLYSWKPRGFIERDVTRAQEAIESAVETTPTLFRAPFGVRWFGLRAVQRRLGLLGVMWTVIGYDWNRAADHVVNRVAKGLCNGAILCLHDGRQLLRRPDIGVTVEAVDSLVPLLLDQGYKLETVSQLLCRKS